MRTNYVLIDFDSVQTRSLDQLTHADFKVIVFVGASQAKVPFELAESLHRFGPRAEYIKISGHGPNALDFHIAYYIGRLAAAEPSAFFHIISNDTGFDPLIKHLRSKKIFARRGKTVADIPAVRALKCKSPQERISVILTRLQQLKTAKPRTIKTLSSTIASLFPNLLSQDEVALLVQNLRDEGYVELAGLKVTYALPADGLKKALPRSQR